jgi:hypothetical protein
MPECRRSGDGAGYDVFVSGGFRSPMKSARLRRYSEACGEAAGGAR